MKFASRTLLCLMVYLLGLATSVLAQAPKLISIDVPSAGTGAGQGTFVSGVTALGAIAGNYVDAKNVSHSYFRDTDGKITTFDPPGTYNAPYPGFNGSLAIAINAEGAVAGAYVDSNFAVHAYIRNPNGKFITYDAPGACTESQNVGCHGSGVWDINAFGVAVGPYEDTSGNFVAHCAIRFHDGQFVTFEVPGSSMLAGQGTLPGSFSGLNLRGAITGLYYDANYSFHGYLRTPDGKFTTIDAPGADVTISFNGTFPSSINDLGAISGYDLDVNELYHSWLRTPNGSFTVFDAPDAGTTLQGYQGTFAQAINLRGEIAGFYSDSNNIYHGFVRDEDGKFTTIDAPGADTKPGDYNGTFPYSINDAGMVVGNYIDSKNVYHGFLRIP